MTVKELPRNNVKGDMSADAADVRVRNANLTLHEHMKPEQGVHTPPEQREPGTERGRQMAMTDSSRSPGVVAEEFTPFKGLACTNSPLYMCIQQRGHS